MTSDVRSLIAEALAAHDPWTSNSVGGGLTWHCGPCDIEEPVKTVEAGDAQVYGHWADAILAVLDGQLVEQGSKTETERRHLPARRPGPEPLPCGGPDLRCTVPQHHEVRTVHTGPWRPLEAGAS